jgi:hypothetical protein
MFSDPIAYFLTWTTYGTWLPGDERGWVQEGQGFQPPDPIREQRAASAMSETTVLLSDEQRQIVDSTLVRHCAIRRWPLHARNVRTNHVHVVVTAAGVDPEIVREQFKAWCSRHLSEAAGLKGRSHNGLRRWWTEKGSINLLFTEEDLAAAIIYVLDGQ